MTDRDAVIETLVQLFIGTDNRDWGKVRRCFAAKVEFDMSSVGAGPAQIKTGQEIADGWDAGLKQVEVVFHQAGNFLVDMQGREASAFCYGIAYHHRKSPLSTRLFLGSYEAHLVNDGGWKIDRFKYNLKHTEELPRTAE